LFGNPTRKFEKLSLSPLYLHSNVGEARGYAVELSSGRVLRDGYVRDPPHEPEPKCTRDYSRGDEDRYDGASERGALQQESQKPSDNQQLLELLAERYYSDMEPCRDEPWPLSRQE
tara:strand:+ start:324 stop:671 length:348 start_codon:yes stop_codon:yes gene_type:complete